MNTRYGLEALNFTLYYEFSALCPPSLTFSANFSSPSLSPYAPDAPCSGHGDPNAFCATTDNSSVVRAMSA